MLVLERLRVMEGEKNVKPSAEKFDDEEDRGEECRTLAASRERLQCFSVIFRSAGCAVAFEKMVFVFLEKKKRRNKNEV